MGFSQVAGIVLTGQGREDVVILDYGHTYPGPETVATINEKYADKGVVFDNIAPEALEPLLPNLQVKWVAIMIDQDSAKILKDGDRSSMQTGYYVNVLVQVG